MPGGKKGESIMAVTREQVPNQSVSHSSAEFDLHNQGWGEMRDRGAFEPAV